ncbi:histone-like nucleoid-structuring protein Lsr2 [Nocardioides jishulii]|uniref:Lsr2 family protein n=1 Tax=Nocardioides jishulii TaxID=2575440 RepID=A0A4U2YT81_9ACTN|nr:Lsr2 family protein [Nocardioides jishulii]QCX28714.1 Lsr2 family protein [Nocardioides jishulii]TKI64390.1 Lsr2 family protein [Nocardioides jishulii]
MAQKVSIVLIDDLDGSPADETVTFGLDGATYEIDLTDANAQKLRDALSGYVGHARKVTGSRRGGAARKSSGSGTDTKAVREWAKANGYDVSERGRVPASVVAAYEAAN